MLARAGERLVLRLRSRVMEHTLRLPLPVVRTAGPGDLVARVTSDAMLLRSVIDMGVVQLPVAVITALGTLVMMALLDWVLVLLTLAAFAVVGVVIWVLMRRVRRGYEAIQTTTGALAQRFTATLTALATVKSCRAELRAAQRLSEDAGRITAATLGAARLQSLLIPVMVLGQEAALAAVVIGGGVSGWNATQIAVGLGFHVTLLDRDINKLREADKIFGTKVKTVVSNAFELEKAVVEADLVIGAVLIPGAKAPKLVTNELVAKMKPGSVLVDIAIDQGGCFEDSHPTTHAEPTFQVHGSVFYCVANMPGAVPNTSTYALTNATLPYIVELANRGWADALRRDAALAKGLNTHEGQVVYREVAEAHGLPHVELSTLLG
ncbi:alanine dehydrogenase [Streptomyces cavourensis]|nr:alanine dehydrogenase [Streptomyces cavourensis]